MPALTITLNLEEDPWRDLEGEPTTYEITAIGVLPNASLSGKPGVVVRIRTPHGDVVGITTLALFQQAHVAFSARYGDAQRDDYNSGIAPPEIEHWQAPFSDLRGAGRDHGSIPPEALGDVAVMVIPGENKIARLALWIDPVLVASGLVRQIDRTTTGVLLLEVRPGENGQPIPEEPAYWLAFDDVAVGTANAILESADPWDTYTELALAGKVPERSRARDVTMRRVGGR